MKAEELADRIREALGEWNDPEVPVAILVERLVKSAQAELEDRLVDTPVLIQATLIGRAKHAVEFGIGATFGEACEVAIESLAPDGGVIQVRRLGAALIAQGLELVIRGRP